MAELIVPHTPRIKLSPGSGVALNIKPDEIAAAEEEPSFVFAEPTRRTIVEVQIPVRQSGTREPLNQGDGQSPDIGVSVETEEPVQLASKPEETSSGVENEQVLLPTPAQSPARSQGSTPGVSPSMGNADLH